MLGHVYGHEAEARERSLTSGCSFIRRTAASDGATPSLHHWLEAQFAEHETEPNSGLGKAITCLLRHWKAPTLFLRKAATPLDNNIVERRSSPLQSPGPQ
jgi:hypothetical protein